MSYSIKSKLIATPVRPYLPVLPILCQKVSVCLASNKITKSNLISIPLDSRSEAMMILVLFIWFIILNRADWDNEPWISTCSNYYDKLWDICSRNDFFSTNIRHFWYSSSCKITQSCFIFESNMESLFYVTILQWYFLMFYKCKLISLFVPFYVIYILF